MASHTVTEHAGEERLGQRRRRVLVVWYSQTGQLKRCVDSLTAPLVDAGFDVRFEELKPVRDYPFPWRLRAFIDVFPETVVGVAPPLEPLSIGRDERFDLVIVAYQVWFLSPSLPVQAFFASPHRAVVADTPVVTLVACRNMWYSAALTMRRLLADAGALHVGHVAATDDGPVWTTFVTTPRWLLTGRRDRFLRVFPPAGIGDASVASLARFGARIAARVERLDGGRLFEGLEPFRVDRRMVMPDLLGGRAFKAWAHLIRNATQRGQRRRPVLLWTFAGWLLTVVPVAVPALALMRPLFGSLVDRLLDPLDGCAESRPGQHATA